MNNIKDRRYIKPLHRNLLALSEEDIGPTMSFRRVSTSIASSNASGWSKLCSAEADLDLSELFAQATGKLLARCDLCLSRLFYTNAGDVGGGQVKASFRRMHHNTLSCLAKALQSSPANVGKDSCHPISRGSHHGRSASPPLRAPGKSCPD